MRVSNTRYGGGTMRRQTEQRDYTNIKLTIYEEQQADEMLIDRLVKKRDRRRPDTAVNET